MLHKRLELHVILNKAVVAEALDCAQDPTPKSRETTYLQETVCVYWRESTQNRIERQGIQDVGPL